jgi:hypothetical protein
MASPRPSSNNALFLQKVQFTCHEECLAFLHSLLSLNSYLASPELKQYIDSNGITEVVDADEEPIERDEEKKTLNQRLESFCSPLTLVTMKERRNLAKVELLNEDDDEDKGNTPKRGILNGGVGIKKKDPFDSFFHPSLSLKRENNFSFPSLPSTAEESGDHNDNNHSSGKYEKSELLSSPLATSIPKPMLIHDDSLNFSEDADSILLMEDLEDPDTLMNAILEASTNSTSSNSQNSGKNNKNKK